MVCVVFGVVCVVKDVDQYVVCVLVAGLCVNTYYSTEVCND